MALGLARGLDRESFMRLVKKMVLVVYAAGQRYECELPLEMFQVPVYNINVTIEEKAK